MVLDYPAPEEMTTVLDYKRGPTQGEVLGLKVCEKVGGILYWGVAIERSGDTVLALWDDYTMREATVAAMQGAVDGNLSEEDMDLSLYVYPEETPGGTSFPLLEEAADGTLVMRYVGGPPSMVATIAHPFSMLLALHFIDGYKVGICLSKVESDDGEEFYRVLFRSGSGDLHSRAEVLYMRKTYLSRPELGTVGFHVKA